MKIDSLYQTLQKKATGGMILVLLVITVSLGYFGFGWRNETLAAGPSRIENPTLDSRLYNCQNGKFLYTPQDIQFLFNRLGSENPSNYAITKLKIYAISEITLDLIFPLLYVSVLTFLVIRLFPPNIALYLILLPVLGGFFDLLENSAIAFSAFTFDNRLSDISYFAAAFTLLKWVLVIICLLMLPGGAIWTIWKKEES